MRLEQYRVKDCLRTLDSEARPVQISSTKSEAALQPQPGKILCLVLNLFSATACCVVSKFSVDLIISTYRRGGGCREPWCVCEMRRSIEMLWLTWQEYCDAFVCARDAVLVEIHFGD